MKKVFLLAVLTLFLFSFIHLVRADFWTSDNLGQPKNSFYTNESVYITSNNSFLTASSTAYVYIVSDNNSWVNQTTLSDVSGGRKTISVNSSGAIYVQSIWNPTTSIGTYDVVIDVDKDGVYNNQTCGTGGDCVFNLTTYGFKVFRTPIPIVAASYGQFNPQSASWTYDSNSPNLVKLQMKLVSDAAEDVKITNIFVSASGTGDDKEGVSAIKLYLDSNGNGVFDQGETLIAYGNYPTDDGVLPLIFTSGSYILPVNTTVNMILVYTMSSKVVSGTTFGGQIAQISANGANTNTGATVTGMPLNLAVTTISGGVTTTTTTTTALTTTTTTTTVPTTTTAHTTTQTTTTTAPSESFLESPWIIPVIIVVVLVPIILLILIRRKKMGQPDRYEALKEKYRGY